MSGEGAPGGAEPGRHPAPKDVLSRPWCRPKAGMAALVALPTMLLMSIGVTLRPAVADQLLQGSNILGTCVTTPGGGTPIAIPSPGFPSSTMVHAFPSRAVTVPTPTSYPCGAAYRYERGNTSRERASHPHATSRPAGESAPPHSVPSPTLTCAARPSPATEQAGPAGSLEVSQESTRGEAGIRQGAGAAGRRKGVAAVASARPTAAVDGAEGSDACAARRPTGRPVPSVSSSPSAPSSPTALSETHWTMTADRLVFHHLRYQGVTSVRTRDGATRKALTFTVETMDLTDLDLSFSGALGGVMHMAAKSGATSTLRGGRIRLYMVGLRGDLSGRTPVTFTPSAPPRRLGAEVSFTDVTLLGLGQFSGTLHIPGLHLYQE